MSDDLLRPDPRVEDGEPLPRIRSYVIEDLHIRSDGGGRVVEAYAADWSRYPVSDQDGHYNEELSPISFNRTIEHKGLRFGVLFNHGLTIDGAPNPQATLPIGVPVEVRPDERGVYTATRYLEHPFADAVLGAVKKGALRAQSFSGRFTKSVRSWPDGRKPGALPLITRHEVDMREYGPAVFAANENAAILGTRAEFFRTIFSIPPDKRMAWLEQFEGLSTLFADPESLTLGTPSGPAVLADDSREHSARPSLRSHIRAARIARHME